MITTVSHAASTQQSSGAQAGSSASTLLDPMATEQSFLQLLVAQLQNQDPLNPQDGTQFVSQLAQMSSLEQEIQMREDLDSMNKVMASQNNPPTNQSGQTNQTNHKTQS